MKVAAEHLKTLDAGRDHKAHAAFTRLVNEPEAPIHINDLRPILTWICEQLNVLSQRIEANDVELLDRVQKLELRQDPEHHNPE